MDVQKVEIRPIVADELRPLELHFNFDWASPGKHRDRLVTQQAGEAVYLLAWDRDLPVGHALLKWNGATDEPMVSGLSDCPDVEDLFVGSEYRSRGIGSRLLDAAESLAVGKGYSRIGLGVSIDNARARSLYERRGYEDSEFGEYRVGDRYVDRDGRERSWEEVCRYLIKHWN
jgi:ribosomal protein S18 acetylase RimI-like enzyme